MITVAEKQELIQLHKRLGELLPRLSAVVQGCYSCGNFKCGFCSVHKSDVPAEFADTGCDKWEFTDIPEKPPTFRAGYICFRALRALTPVKMNPVFVDPLLSHMFTSVDLQ